MKIKGSILLIIFILSTTASVAQDDPFIGEIKMFAGNFAPRGWAFCDGQELAISQYQALFSLLGTNYGGDGRTTFRVPDLRDRTPVHVGRSEDISYFRVGDKGGSVSKELTRVTVAEEVKGESFEIYTVRSGNDKLHTRDPYLRVNFIIALQGVFPSRN